MQPASSFGDMEKSDVMVFEQPRRQGGFAYLWNAEGAQIWTSTIGPLFAFVLLILTEAQFASGHDALIGIMWFGAGCLFLCVIALGFDILEGRVRPTLRIDVEGVRLTRFFITRKAAWQDVTRVRFMRRGPQDEYCRIMVLYRASGIFRHYPGYRPFPLMHTLDRDQSEAMRMELEKRQEANPAKYAFEIVEDSARQKPRRPAVSFWWLFYGYYFLVQGVLALVYGGVLLYRDPSAEISWPASFANGSNFGRFLLMAGAVSTAIGGACRWRFSVLQRAAGQAADATHPEGGPTLSN